MEDVLILVSLVMYINVTDAGQTLYEVTEGQVPWTVQGQDHMEDCEARASARAGALKLAAALDGHPQAEVEWGCHMGATPMEGYDAEKEK